MSLVLGLILLCTVSALDDAPVSITPINETGFHYEFHSRLGFVVNSWSFVVNVNHTILLDRVRELRNTASMLLQAFHANGSLQHCEWTVDDGDEYARELTYLVDRRVASLLDTHHSIEALLVHGRAPQRRLKRNLFNGAFNFVGRVDKYLFGVMDDKDATMLYDLISRENSTEYRIKTLTNETLRLAEVLQNMRHELENKLGCKYLNRQLVYFKQNMDEIEKLYDKIVAAIEMAMFANKIHPSIIDPLLLMTEMESVDSNALDRETRWVVNPASIHDIVHLTKCSVFLNPQGNLTFVVQVPRMDKSVFTLYQTVPLPQCQTNRLCKFIAPQSKFIGFEDRSDGRHYVRLDDTNGCAFVNDLTLCYKSMTVGKIDYSPSCDVRLFKNLTHDSCSVHASKFSSEIFQPLNDVNRWLYVINGNVPVRATVNCESGKLVRRIKLQGMGILTIKRYCKFTTSKTLLMNKHNFGMEKGSYTAVGFNFSRYIIPNDFDTNAWTIKTLDYDTLIDVTRSLKKLVTQEQADTALAAPSSDDYSNSNWYANLFGNWWWEVKFVVYAICILIAVVVVLNTKRVCGGCCGSEGTFALRVLSPK
ncbi:efp [Clostera anastomosis granulovirus A]|uniref:Efp n=1 Tax=Clostera anastomosis granulovirus A TaxID=1986289 RepID=U5KB84_9BBAC|nr:efp [Clostera anastomosis granulovirus Henan]AGQ20290.1 efp [Clostera anastomosis granulovirus Henan]